MRYNLIWVPDRSWNSNLLSAS